MSFEARSLKFLEKFICLYHHSRVGLTTRLASLDTLAPKPHRYGRGHLKLRFSMVPTINAGHQSYVAFRKKEKKSVSVNLLGKSSQTLY